MEILMDTGAFCHIQADRLFLCIFSAYIVKFKIIALVHNHGICLNIKLMTDLRERINIIVHGIDQLFLNLSETLLCASCKITVNRKSFLQAYPLFSESLGIISSVVNGGKYSILLKVIFAQCNTKGRNK